MNQALLNQNQLKEWSKCGQLNKLEQWLKENGIKYFKNGKGEIVSTVEACNSALLNKKHEEIDQPDNAADYIVSTNEIVSKAERYTHLGVGPNECGVYFLLRSGCIRYVGKATSIARRLRAHKIDRVMSFDQYSFIKTPSVNFARSLEAFYINKLSPQDNSVTPPMPEQFTNFHL